MTDLSRYASDPAFTVTWIVIDFEGTTPAGLPLEPIEVGAVLLRRTGATLVEMGRFEALMRPPAHAPVTAHQIGITAAQVADRPPAATVLAGLDHPPYVTVAHHAATEAGIIARYATSCPTLAAAPVLCTRNLARYAYPGLASYSLDALLTHTQIPIPAARHRALPDAAATAALLPRLVTDGAAHHRWSRLQQLLHLAGRPAPGALAA